jgi:hypothetical protein
MYLQETAKKTFKNLTTADRAIEHATGIGRISRNSDEI